MGAIQEPVHCGPAGSLCGISVRAEDSFLGTYALLAYLGVSVGHAYKRHIGIARKTVYHWARSNTTF